MVRTETGAGDVRHGEQEDKPRTFDRNKAITFENRFDRWGFYRNGQPLEKHLSKTENEIFYFYSCMQVNLKLVEIYS